jgi:hypothetical protein
MGTNSFMCEDSVTCGFVLLPAFAFLRREGDSLV